MIHSLLKLKFVLSVFILLAFVSNVKAQWQEYGVPLVGSNAGDFFGAAVALSQDGSVMAVGSPENSTVTTSSGDVKVYQNSGGNWVPLGNALLGNTTVGFFGGAVSLSADGNILAVGSKGVNNGQGQVHVFEFDGSSWNPKGYPIMGSQMGEGFGHDVALNASGDLMVVGAPYSTENGTASGHAKVFEFDGNEWQQVGSKILGQNANGAFGYSVDICDNNHTIVVGAPFSASGKAIVYEYTGNWNLKGSGLQGEMQDDHFGHSVSISSDGNTIAVGAKGNDLNDFDAGAVYVYEYASNWQPKGSTIIGDAVEDLFGWSVGLSNDANAIVIGAKQNDANGMDAGQVSVYDWDANNWTIRGQSLLGDQPYDYFGSAVAISGDAQKISVGAYNNSDNGTSSGHVKAFEFAENTGGGLLAHYPFNGNANDESGNGFDGDYTSFPPSLTEDRFGNAGSAFYFDGVDDKIILPAIDTLDVLTLSVWFKLETFDNNKVQSPIGSATWSGGSMHWNIEPDGSYMAVAVNDWSSPYIATNHSFADDIDQWVNVCYVFKGDIETKIYINGELDQTHLDNYSIKLGDLLIGTCMLSGDRYFQGVIDDIKLYNRELSDNEIQNLYHENGWGDSQQTDCLVGHYPLDGDINDATGQLSGQNFGGGLDMNRFEDLGSAMYFDGAANYATIPDGLGGFSNGTISIWVHANDLNNYTPILSKSGMTYTNDFALYIANGSPEFTLADIPLATGDLINDNQWHHIVCRWNGMDMHLIVDGQVIGTMPNTMGTEMFAGQELYIARNTDGNEYFGGRLDDLRIYQCAISDQEVLELYHERMWGYEPFQTECFNFNDNQVPEGWQISHGDSAFIANGKFMTVNTGVGNPGGEMQKFGAMPENLDSVIIEWDAQVVSTNPFHITAVGVALMDTMAFFGHMHQQDYDYGLVALPNHSNSGNDEEMPFFWKLDSSLIEPGIYRNKLIMTNGQMLFTSKRAFGNHIPFIIEADPFELYENYSLQDISGIIFYQEASEMIGFNWMDNICIKLIEREESCEIATYKFNGNRADNSGNGLHLSQIENGPVMFVDDRFGNASRALELNVNNQEIFTYNSNVPNIIGDFTLSTWVKPQDYSSGTDTAMIFSSYADDSEGTSMMIGIFEQTGQVFFGHLNAGGNLMISLSDFVIPIDVWSHLALRRETSSSTYTLFWNGELVETYNYPSAPNNTGSSYVFSVSDNDPNFSYKGAIDGLRLWSCLLEDQLVDSIYHAGGWPQVMCDDMNINVSTTNAACNIVNGTATVTVTGGSGDYTITWSNGDEGNYADSLSAGMHSVQVTDNQYGCMLNQFFYINNTGAPSVELEPSHLACYQAEDGAIGASVSGGVSPYILEWSNGSSDYNITGLSAGTYMLTVVDGAGCVVTEESEITQPEELQATFDVTNSSCGNNDGEITVNVSGGTGTYTYTWSNGAPDNATISNIPAANYTVVVEDENACTASFTTGFSDSGSPIAMVDSTVSATCGELGSLYISVTGGSGSYTYEWNNGEDTEDLEEFDPGEYWLTVTDGTCMTMLHADIPYEYPQTQEICVVTVDQTTATNLVVWEKEVSTSISHYNIYREGFVAGDYQLVGTVPYDDMSEYSDPVASPFNRSWKYKVSAVDGCGNETELSGDHKTIHLTINVGLGGSINLLWDDYAGFDYTSFYINKHTTAGGWEVLDQMPTYLHSYSDNPTDLYGLWYTVTVDAPGQCVPTSSDKASGGPYYQSVSNLEDEGSIDTRTEEKIERFDMQLFPNPNNGYFIIGFNHDYSGEIEIIDISGKQIYKDAFSNIKKWTFEDQIESGVYMIRVVVDNNATKTLRMIVE
jgi:hypothetical protein